LELDAWTYDHHLETIVRYQTGTDETHIFPQDFSVILFLQEFIEYYPNAPIGSKTAVFKSKTYVYLSLLFRIIEILLAIIHHQLDQTTKRSADSYLFKYVLDHADSYSIKIKRRNSVSSLRYSQYEQLINSILFSGRISVRFRIE